MLNRVPSRPAKDFPDAALIRRAIKEALINNIVVTPVFMVLVFWPLSEWRGVSAAAADFPSFTHALRDIVVCMLVEDTMFYWLHRGLHHPAIYKYVHKQHHQFNFSIGVAAEYAHPIEGIVGSSLPFITGPLLMRSHLIVMLV